MRIPGLGGWSEDPLWAHLYDWSVEHPRVGAPLWRLVVGSDQRLLHEAAAEIERLPAGARVLDVPCGGGVALRGLRPGEGVHHVAADISAAMLARTAAVARRRGVADQVRPVLADVGALPIGDGEVDLVVTLTGLHCFPDPRRAVREMARVLRPGGVLTGSALLEDTGWRYEPLRRVGRAAGLLGPGCTSADLRRWLAADGLAEVRLRTSGALTYVRAVKPAAGSAGRAVSGASRPS